MIPHNLLIGGYLPKQTLHQLVSSTESSCVFHWQSSKPGVKTFLLVQGNNFTRVESAQCVIVGLGHISDNRSDVGEKVIRRIQRNFHNCWDHIKKLEGSFSLVMVDKVKNKAMIYQNIAGLPCIYYIWNKDLALFSDSLSFLVRVLSRTIRQKLSVNSCQVPTYLLYSRTLWGKTLFKNIRRTMPGELLCLGRDKLFRSQVMKLSDMKVSRSKDSVEDLERVMKKITREYAATYPRIVNMFSGGVDSSYIQAHLSSLPCSLIRTCSVDFVHPLWKIEREYARSGSEFFKSDHTFVKVLLSEYPKLLTETISYLGQPLRDAQTALVVKLFKSLENDSSVVICGLCADSLFGLELCEDIDGARLIEKAVPFKAFRRTLLKISRSLRKKCGPRVLDRLTTIIELDLHHELSPTHPFNMTDNARFEGVCKLFGYKEVAKAILQRQALMKHYYIEGSLKERYHSFRLLNCAQGMAEEFYQLASISGLNILFPYLDSRLIKTALSMGESRFPYRILGTKIVIKDALRNYLPQKLISRKKSAWGLPILEAMAPGGVLHPLVKELEYSPFATSKPKVADAFLWSLLNFNIWRTQFLGTYT